MVRYAPRIVRYAPRIHFEAVRYDLWSCPLRSSASFFEDVFLAYAVETAVGIGTLSRQLC